MKRINEEHQRTGIRRTLFAACPNSTAVIKAAIHAAKRNQAPIKFAATLNQVDTDGGYTGMNMHEFVNTVRLEAEAVGFNGPAIIAIDHGGPWLKDKQSVEQWSLAKAMDGIKESFIAAVDAGYDLIHVDPTVDISIDKNATIAIETVAERTIELIRHIETYRRAKNLPAISYEVGTEEVHGGLADEKTFDRFLMLLKSGLAEVGLEDVWPCFIVGKVGTDLHTTLFDPEVAKNLTQKAAAYNSYIKGHYTDGVENPAEYPLSGMGAANVGPEFTIAEYIGLIEAANIEENLLRDQRIAKASNIIHTLRQAVIESGRWKKWLNNDERGKEFSILNAQRQEWLIQTGCRYIWQNPQVVAARALLYANLSRNGFDGEAIVMAHIEHSMDKYFNAFNLVGFNDLINN